ncbi:MAG: hypothetical protein PHG23_01875 [Candidatus Pacebacteria bacterium]|nr:hypothetical protein [Candidatus Paceibacterota bacterium]
MDSRFEGPFLKSLAVILVFGVSMSIPVVVYDILKKSADNLMIKRDLDQIKTWGQIYKIKNGSYKGVNTYIEVIKKKIDIDTLGGKTEVYVSPDSINFCAKSKLLNSRKNWCVDSTGYVGENANACNKGGIGTCQ